MQLSIPDELIVEQLADQVINLILSRLDERLKLLNKAEELPAYPNKSEVKSILGMGDEMLKDWIADGLPVIPWSKKEDRFDRDDIRAHINNMKI